MTVILVSPGADQTGSQVAGMALRAALTASFGDVHCMHDASAAQEAASACPRPVLVLDLRAAGADGEQLPEALRRGSPSAPILALQAAGQPVPPGVDAVLSEPFYLEDVVRWCARSAEAPFDESMLADLATGMRHEIGNPLTSLLLQLELLKTEEAPESIRTQLGLIEDSGRRIQKVVEDVSGAAERRPITASSQSLAELLAAARERLATLEPEHVDRLDVRVPDASVEQTALEVEAPLMARALADVWRFLLLAGEDRLHVVALRPAPDTLLLRTRARTPRLPADAAARLFTPLWARHTLGLVDELSLSTARSILRRHLGDLHARQEPGGSLRVDATFPCQPQAQHNGTSHGA